MPTRTRGTGKSSEPTARTRRCSRTRTSRPCTSRFPTRCTSSGRSVPSKPASTCSARSRSTGGREEVERAFDAADSAGRLLMEAFMYRHNPQTQQLVELVRGGADRRAARHPVDIQLLRLRPREHQAAGRPGRREPDGRRLLLRERLAPARRRADSRPRRGLRRPDRHRLGLRRDDALPRRRHRPLRLRHLLFRYATSWRRSAPKARSSSMTRGTAARRSSSCDGETRRSGSSSSPSTPTGSSSRT